MRRNLFPCRIKPGECTSDAVRDEEGRQSSVIRPLLPQTQTWVLWHFGEGSSVGICSVAILRINLKEGAQVHKEVILLLWANS